MKYRAKLLMAFVLLLATFASFALRPFAGELPFDPGRAIRATIAYLEREHLARKKLDDAVAHEWFEGVLKRLDPRRMYFLQADLQEFRPFVEDLSASARKGDFEFPKLVRSRYRKRVAEAAEYAKQALSVDHDFTLDEELPLEFETWPADGGELRERWRLRIKGEILFEKANGTPLAGGRSWLNRRYERIARQAREMSNECLCDIFLDSLCAVYDPHSSYLTPTEVSEFYH